MSFMSMSRELMNINTSPNDTDSVQVPLISKNSSSEGDTHDGDKSDSCFWKLLHKIPLKKPLEKEVWQLIVSIFVLYNCFLVPMRDIIFIADMVLCARTTFRSYGEIIVDTKEVFWNYLTGWFWLDLLGTVPFDLFYWHNVWGHQLLRTTRFIRLPHTFSYFSVLELESKKSYLYLLFKLVIVLILINHFLACIYFTLAYFEGFGSYPMLPPVEVLSKPFYTQYLYGVFWSTHVVTRIGGSVTPSTDVERLFMYTICYISIFLVASIIGGVTEVVGSISASNREFRKRVVKVQQFMNQKKIPKALQDRVLDYYAQLWARSKGTDEERILSELPQHLINDINLNINQDIIDKVYMFSNSEKGFLQLIVGSLKPQVFSPGDYIMKAGEAGDCMYFLNKGAVQVSTANGEPICVLKEGDFFGEIVLLVETTRTATVQAIKYCDVFRLSKKTLKNALKSFPSQVPFFREVAHTRIAADLLRKLLPNHVYFKHCSSEFQSQLAKHFESRAYQKDHYITRLGEKHHKFLFVGHGEVNVLGAKGNLMMTLEEGSFYGGMDLLQKVHGGEGPTTGYNSEVSIQVASELSIIFSIGPRSLACLSDEYPDQVPIMQRLCKKFQPHSTMPVLQRVKSNFSVTRPGIRDQLKKKMSGFLRMEKRPVKRVKFSEVSIDKAKKGGLLVSLEVQKRIGELKSEIHHLSPKELVSALKGLSELQQSIVELLASS